MKKSILLTIFLLVLTGSAAMAADVVMDEEQKKFLNAIFGSYCEFEKDETPPPPEPGNLPRESGKSPRAFIQWMRDLSVERRVFASPEDQQAFYDLIAKNKEIFKTGMWKYLEKRGVSQSETEIFIKDLRLGHRSGFKEMDELKTDCDITSDEKNRILWELDKND